MGEPAAPTRVIHRMMSVVENVQVARSTFRIRFYAPDLASLIVPGQFVMIRPGAQGGDDPLLGRPFALYDVVADGSGVRSQVDFVYLVVGRGTAALSSRRRGERLAVWGPLGNGFSAQPPTGHVVFVAGGIGQTPFLALGRGLLGEMAYGASDSPWSAASRRGPGTAASLLYGARTSAYFAGLDDFRRAGIEVELATDDGSAGHHGRVTDLLSRRLERGALTSLVVGCGPPAMLRAVAELVNRHGVPGEVSLENGMACGFGACFSCVTPIRQADGTSDLRRVCLEGPVFRAHDVDWAAMVD